MPTLNLGRVGFVNKGTWLISTAYKINDTVTYLGGTYACLIANTGQTPILGGTIYWQEWVSEDTVHRSGAETITGLKTFSAGIKVEGANVTAYGKNYIINGGFDYWNYATSQTASGYGSDDRWNNNHVGSTKTHSLVNSTDTERALFNSSKFSRTVVTSVAGVNNLVDKFQAIENITKLAGKTVTISFWAKADTNKNIALELIQNFGTGGTPSVEVTSIGSQLVALTSTWQKKTITVLIPSIVGKTLGTDGVHTSMTQLIFWFDAGSNFAAQSANLGQQSGTFDIAEVKLEEGSVATPWTPYEGEFGGEVQACQRYLPVFGGVGSDYFSAGATGATGGIAVIPFKVPTRIPPTGLILTGLTGALFYNGGGVGIALSSLTFSIAGNHSVVCTATVASGLTAGQHSFLALAGNKLYFTGCEL